MRVRPLKRLPIPPLDSTLAPPSTTLPSPDETGRPKKPRPEAGKGFGTPARTSARSSAAGAERSTRDGPPPDAGTPPPRAQREGIVFDASALDALRAGHPTMTHLTKLVIAEGRPLATSAGAVARAWRPGRGQAALTYLLRRTDVVDLTATVARHLGRVLGASGSGDPIDAHVLHLAQDRGWPIVSANAQALRAIDPGARIEEL